MTSTKTCPRCGKHTGNNDWDLHTCTPKEQFIRDSMRIKTEMIKELIWERDSLEFRISSMQLEIDKLKAELAKLTK